MSPNGFEVFAGRDCNENEALTFQEAHPDDVWFHASDVPGSHVVLKHLKDKDHQHCDILFAAHVAAQYSKAKTHKKVKVDYCMVGDVTKPLKASKGMVHISNHRQVTVVMM
jgi:predicted ribosome quality control (RQC) complex YloA/Tae2 family protein